MRWGEHCGFRGVDFRRVERILILHFRGQPVYWEGFHIQMSVIRLGLLNGMNILSAAIFEGSKQSLFHEGHPIQGRGSLGWCCHTD